MIQEINTTRTTHIITIEDPIEFLIRDKKSIITQREVSLDTRNFASALRNALRQDPDVILVGEVRDRETIDTVLMAAETGHLVLSTLHTNDATESINRIISVFEAHQQDQIRVQLASVLRAVVSQRLVPRKDGQGLVAACEVMVVNARVRDLILDPKRTNQLIQAIEDGGHAGMISFDQSLMALVKQGVISYEDAVTASTNPTDFELRYKGVASMDGNKWNEFDGGINVKNTPTAPKGGDLRETIVDVETAQWPAKKQRRK
jgi:twitching motility protein PilT